MNQDMPQENFKEINIIKVLPPKPWLNLSHHVDRAVAKLKEWRPQQSRGLRSHSWQQGEWLDTLKEIDMQPTGLNGFGA
ncbi:hypothetical protein [Acerihabitans arboris]|uniref:Uncharacterized protein n=1 Tax=Acerihabitans arboris TaxID=2691583 RepID=A0A845SEJ9_9GAMM|nr:hypothetical protein [Acerihabitans arboris]NDL63220.1 hypothetical protein [Acerihabitans arboris]